MNRFLQRQQSLPLPRFRPAKGWIVGCLLAGLATATGCQQPNGQMGLPANPMVGSTRVPAPPTGSVGATSGYASGPFVQGSYAAQPPVGLPASDLMAQVGPPPPGSYAASNPYATNPFAAAGNVPPAGSLAANSDFPPATQYAVTPQYAPSPAAALQQAGYAETSASGHAVAPTVSLAPQLRGMQVNDLTPAGQAPHLQAQAQAQAQRQSQAQLQAQAQTHTSAAWSSQATGRPTSGLTPLRTAPAALSPVPTQPSNPYPAASQQDSWNVVGSGVAAPSTTPVVREASNPSSQSLPWRAPTTAR